MPPSPSKKSTKCIKGRGGERGVKGVLNNVKKDCVICKSGHPLLYMKEMKSLKWELHSCQYRGTWPNWFCLYFWMVVDIEVLRKQGGAHSREGRDKTPVKRLSRLFAHHCSLRPHPCLYNYIFLQKLYSKPVNKPHTRVRCKQAGYLHTGYKYALLLSECW